MSMNRRHGMSCASAMVVCVVISAAAHGCSSDPSGARPRDPNAGAGALGGASGANAGAGGDIDNPSGNGGYGGLPCSDCNGDASVGDGGTILIPRSHEPCDGALELASQDAMDGARALGVCPGAASDDTGTGFRAAEYGGALDGSPAPDPLQIGLVERFGPIEPREGERMLLLSSGVARAPDQAGHTATCDIFGEPGPAPDGYPFQAPRCLDVTQQDVLAEIYDAAALELELEVPPGAVALSVDFNFYTSEFPDYVCGIFNDFFVLLMDPAPAGALRGNVAFDEEGNPISVNTGLLRACDETAVTNPALSYACDLGTEPLIGTGFAEDDCLSLTGLGGATGWLTTTVPVEEGSTIRLRFVIWDTGAPTLDSSVLIDNMRFVGDDVVMVPPSGPGTKPSAPE